MGIALLLAAVSSLNSPRRNSYEVESRCNSDSGGAFCTCRCCGGTEYERHGQQQFFEPERDRQQQLFEPERDRQQQLFESERDGQQQVFGQRFRRCFEQLVLAEQQLLVLAQQLFVLAQRGFAQLVFAELVFFVVLAERLGRREQLQQLDPVVLVGRQEQRRLGLASGMGRVLQQVGQRLQLLERRHVQQLAELQLAEQQQQLLPQQQLQLAEQQRHGQLELRFGHEQRLQQLRDVRLEQQQVKEATLKLICAATAAALFALSGVSLAQGTGSTYGGTGSSAGATGSSSTPGTGSSGVSGSSGASSSSSKCLGMMGSEREKCLKDEGITTGSSAGGTSSSSLGSSGAVPGTGGVGSGQGAGSTGTQSGPEPAAPGSK